MHTPLQRLSGPPCAALALSLALAASCGGDEPPTTSPGGSDAASAARADRRFGGGGGKRSSSEQERIELPPWNPPQPVEVVEVELAELPTLFSGRTQPATEAMRAHMDRFETDDTYWPTETVAERAEAALSGVLRGLLRGEDPTCAALAFLGPLERSYGDGHLEVDRRLRAELDPAAAAERFETVLAELRAALGASAGAPGLDVVPLVTAIDGDGEQTRTRALVTVATRPASGEAGESPQQLSLELEARWSSDPDGALKLERLELTDLEHVRAASPLFAEITPAVLGGEPYYERELMRGVDDYFTRLDRNGGASFQGMQGVSVGDVNGDGREDVFLCQQVGVPNRLLLRNADGTATDVSGEAKVRFLDVTRTALIVDLDGDGHRDLALAVGPTLVIAYNDGTGSFARQIGLPSEGQEQIYNLSAADADGDGDLDVYAGRYALEGVMHGVPTPYHDASNGSTNSLWRNLWVERGEREFENATEEAGLDVNNTRFTLSSIWDDFDEDGDLDLYVVNDFGRNNLFRNDGEGHFEDVAESLGALDIGAGMGATVVDYDGDGDQDLYVTNMFSAPGLRITAQGERFMDGEHPEVLPWYAKHARGNSLLRNRGDGSFEDVTDTARVALARWAWGGIFTDMNNDGWEDLYVPCGHATKRGAEQDLEAFFWHRVISSSPAGTVHDEEYAAAFGAVHRMVTFGNYSWSGEERNLAYLNTGAERFADASAVSGLDWPDDSRAAALMDWDDDGRIDILLKNRNAPRLRILHNRSRAEQAHWIAFELVGAGVNTDAIGARVQVRSGADASARTQRKRIHAGEGYLAQSSPRPHFGLAAATAASVEVLWPDGTTEDFGTLEADRRWRLVQGAGSATPVQLQTVPAERLEAGESRWNPAPVARVPLAARLPMAPFAIPTFDRPNRRVSDLAGAPALLLLYGSSQDGSHTAAEGALSSLAARAQDLNAGGLRVVPLAIDQGPQLGKARRLAAEYDLAEETGYADGRVLETFEMVFLEVLGFFDEVPSPSALLLDPEGNLCVLYVGPPSVDDVLDDLETVNSFAPGATGTGRFGGGRWMVRRSRDLDTLGQIFSSRGHVDIGRYYRELAR